MEGRRIVEIERSVEENVVSGSLEAAGRGRPSAEPGASVVERAWRRPGR
jgi:hypothetical protein